MRLEWFICPNGHKVLLFEHEVQYPLFCKQCSELWSLKSTGESVEMPDPLGCLKG